MLIVQKYGGTSVGDPEKIKKIAKRIIDTKIAGNQIIVVVSAPGHTTDELLDMAYKVTKKPDARELDMLLSAGERISIALLGMAISSYGEPVVSLTGSQAGIITDCTHTKAKIIEIKGDRIKRAIDEGKIVIVAGFQGVSTNNDVTTLGRGGSDLSAVALAANLGAASCEIYTDVDGVYTADPTKISDARLLKKISYEEMLEMAACGANIMQTRAVEYARSKNVILHIRSSFKEMTGTVVDEKGDEMENAIISGVTYDSSEAKITILGVPDMPGIAASVFGSLADNEINVDMILQNVSQDGQTDISFTLPKSDLATAKEIMKQVTEKINARGYTCDEAVAKISLIGAGMKTHPGVAAKMFRVLAENNVNIQMIGTSTIKISCVVAVEQGEKAVRSLHNAFELAEEPVVA